MACMAFIPEKGFPQSSRLHVTAADEERDIRRLGLAGPVIVAPLGVTLPPLPHRKIDPGKRVFLFVSRIQQKKGLVNLVRAVASLNKRGEIGPPAVCQFRIVGPDQEGHTAELRTEAKEHGVLDYFDFAGAKYGAELADEYARADVFVLPTFSENFGVVVIDALSYGVPVITTRGAPWSEIEQFKCGWWVEVGVEPLMVALKAALDCSWEELRAMGARGRQLVESRYTWPHAADALIRGYMAQPVIATRMGLRCGESGGRT